MTLDSYLNKLGPYQIKLMTCCLIVGIEAGMQALVFTFTMGVPNGRCVIPGLDNGTTSYNDVEFDKFYLDPKDQSGSKLYCSYCPSLVNASTANCTADLATKCDHGYVFDHSQFHTSLTIDFEMVCESGAWKLELAKSMFQAGVLIGATMTGFISDRFGRRRSFIVFSILTTITTNVTPLLTKFSLICLFQVFNGAFQFAPSLILFNLLMEILNSKWRSVFGMFSQSLFTVGYLIVGLLAYLIREWKYLMWATTIPNALLLLTPGLRIIPESYRWCIVNKRKDQAVGEIARICKENKIHLPDGLFEKAFEMESNMNERGQSNPNKQGFLDLFKHISTSKITLIIMITWFAASICYYGLALNAADLPGNPYLIYSVLGIVELPAYFLSIFMMEYWGRKPTLLVMMIIGGVTVVVSSLLSSYPVAAVVMAVVGKGGAAGAFAVVYNYSAELFPTVVRNSGLGVSSTCARIGSVLAPYIHLLQLYTVSWLPFFMYGLCAFVAGVLDIFLPETLGKAMPETISDMIVISKGQRSLQRKITPRLYGLDADDLKL